MVPLYFAMLVAYGSVKWCKIFSPEQCSGINQFVAVFAVPVLSFHFISQNNPYEMDTKFIVADTLSKLLVLVLLSVWAILFKGGLDWLITLLSRHFAKHSGHGHPFAQCHVWRLHSEPHGATGCSSVHYLSIFFNYLSGSLSVCWEAKGHFSFFSSLSFI